MFDCTSGCHSLAKLPHEVNHQSWLSMTCFSVCLGCHNKIPYTNWMAQTGKIYFFTILETGSPGSRYSRVSFWWELSFWFADSQFLAVSSHGKENKPSGVSSSKDTNAIGPQGTTLMTSLILITPQGGQGFNI